MNCNEIETLTHDLGTCDHGELLRHKRHSKVVLGNELKKNWTVVEEFVCLSVDGTIEELIYWYMIMISEIVSL